jgi:hypothetical protein
MGAWLDIDTAPKDGTRVLVAPGRDGSLKHPVVASYHSGGWYVRGIGQLYGKTEPVAWQKLPELP